MGFFSFPELLWKHSPERMTAYKDGYAAGKRDAILELKAALKSIKDLEAFRPITSTFPTSPV